MARHRDEDVDKHYNYNMAGLIRKQLICKYCQHKRAVDKKRQIKHLTECQVYKIRRKEKEARGEKEKKQTQLLYTTIDSIQLLYLQKLAANVCFKDDRPFVL